MFTAAHIPEVDNVAADALSHNNDSFSPPGSTANHPGHSSLERGYLDESV